MLRVILH